MIHFEITAGPDLNVLSDFKYFQNQICLGKGSGDLWIKDPDLRPIHLMLEVIGEDLLVHPQKDVEFYLLNQKRTTAIRKLKVNDVIQIGSTSLKILGFEETKLETKKNFLDKRFNQLMEEDSPLLAIIEDLTKKMNDHV